MSLLPSLNIPNLLTGLVNQVFVKPVGTSTMINSNFVFDIIEEDEVSLMSDITDHFVEANYAIQDHITIKPLKFTVRGFVGELVKTKPQSIYNTLVPTPIQSILNSAAPKFASQAQAFFGKIENIQNQVNRVVSQVNNVYDLLTNKTTASSKQQQAYYTFKNLQAGRALCQVDTPFDSYKNMAIETVTIVQKGHSNMVSEFSVTFKQINTVDDLSLGAPVATGRVANSLSPAINMGTVLGTPISTPKVTSLMQMSIGSTAGFR